MHIVLSANHRIHVQCVIMIRLRRNRAMCVLSIRKSNTVRLVAGDS